MADPTKRPTGLPERSATRSLFYLPEPETLVCYCEVGLGHVRPRCLFYRSIHSSEYAPLVTLDDANSIDGVVVAPSANLLVASIVTLKEVPGGTWAGFEVGLVRIEVGADGPEIAPLMPPFDSCPQLVSLTPDGQQLYCVAGSDHEDEEGGSSRHYSLVRWRLASTEAEVLCPLPGVRF